MVLGTKTVLCSDHLHGESSSDSDIGDSRLVTFAFPRLEWDIHGNQKAVSAVQKHEGATRAHLDN